MPDTLTIEDIAARVSAHLRQDTLPPAGSERLVRFGQGGDYEVIGEQPPWWTAFAQHEPDQGSLIEMTQEGPRPLDSTSALDRLRTYEFGRGAWLDFIERPLNNLSRQFPYTGSILVGGLPALVTAQAIDGFVEGSAMTPETQTWVKIGAKVGIGVGLPLFFGNMFMSRNGQLIYGGILIASAALDLPLLNRWIKNGVIWVRNLFRDAGNKIPFEQSFGNLPGYGQVDTSHMLGAGDWGTLSGAGGGRVSHAQVSPGSGGPGPDPMPGARGY